MIVYAVIAYRENSRMGHSYLVGIYSTGGRAIQAATNEEYERGGKYICEVLEATIDKQVTWSGKSTDILKEPMEQPINITTETWLKLTEQPQ